MPSVSVRLRKTSNVAGRVAHDFRTRTPGYADPDRQHLNAVLHGHPVEQADLKAELERLHLEHTGRRRRKDSALIWEGIITFSADADLTDRKAYDAAAQRLVNEIAARHGFNEPLWLVRHEDESRPHYHFAFANAHAKTAKPVRLSPSDMRQLQDMAGQCFEPLGLSRGKPKAERIADGEPAHKWLNRSVRQLHHDLPAEIEALKQRIEELTEKERKAAARLEKTQAKLEQAQGENEQLQKRLETYQKRLEKTQQELKQAQAEIKRLKKLIEPQKPEPIQIQHLVRWEETGWWPLKRQEPVLKTTKIITPKQHEQALIATRKAAEEEAKRKAEQAVQDELDRLHRLEQEQAQTAQIFEAIREASDQFGLSSAEPEPDEKLWLKEKIPPEIVHYNATLLDYETRLVAVGDGTPIQQAAALYRAAREKGWERAVFWGLDEDQIVWLVKAAERDGYEIDFKTKEAQEIAERVQAELAMKQPRQNPNASDDYDMTPNQ